MNTIEQAREVVRCLRTLTRNRNDGSAYPIAADTIDALIAELEVERSCCELAVKQAETLVNQRNRLTAELERVTTLARGQHVELYNARLELERLKSQESVAIADGDAHSIRVRLLPDGVDLKPDTKLFLAAGAQPAPKQEPSKAELLDLLDTFITAYEDGVQCYADPEDCSGFIGNAVRLDDEVFNRACNILNKERPRSVTSVEPTQAQEQRKPLTDEQCQAVIDSMPTYDAWGRTDKEGDVNLHEFARAIEQAHLIGEQP